MARSLYTAYMLVQALWVGGMVMFTFLVTPALFKYLSRDEASRAVDRLFPFYFPYCLVLIVLALAFLIALGGFRVFGKASPVLLGLALVASLYLNFSLYPRIAEVKKDIPTFETAAEPSEARMAFRRLHAQSAVINLALIADGTALLVIAVFRGGRGLW